MKRIIFSLTFLIVLMGALCPVHSKADDGPRRLFFLHHSTGRLLLEQGNARQLLSDLNDARSSDFVLWDHDYNYIGLSDNDGDLLGYHYSIPNDDTYPEGLHQLFTTNNSARDSLLARYDVIAFKSCYPTSDIASEAQLQQYKTWYLEMRDFFDQHPEKIFIIMSQPPRHRLATNSDHADRARRFADWLVSNEYLSGHNNLVGFDFFKLLANPDDGSATANMLRYEYEMSHTNDDSHPNALANQTNAPLFIQCLADAVQPNTSTVRSSSALLTLKGNYPNPFNPTTIIAFETGQSCDVNIDVLDIRGQRLRSLSAGRLDAGSHQVLWDGKDDHGQGAASGIYFYQVRAGDHRASGRMILTR